MHQIELREVFIDPDFLDVPSLICDVYVHDIDRVVGRVEFRQESGQDLLYYGNVGYVIYQPYRGHGYAYKATDALIKKVYEDSPDLEAVYITCNPDNIASKKTIEKLDAHFLGCVDVDKKHELYRMGDKQKNVYVIYLK